MNKNGERNSFKSYLNFDARTLAIMGLFIALSIIFSDVLSFKTWSIRIGFGFVPLVLASMLLGPIKGAIVAAISDIIGALLVPSGNIHLGFTLTALLVGLLYGIFLYKKQSYFRIAVSVIIHQLCFTLLLNSFWISQLSHTNYKAAVAPRLFQVAIMIPVQFITIVALSRPKIKTVWKYLLER